MEWIKINHWTELLTAGPVLIYYDRDIYSLHSVNIETHVCEVIDIARPHSEFRRMLASDFTHYCVITPPED